MKQRLLILFLFIHAIGFAQTIIHVGIWEKFDKYSLPPQNVYVNQLEFKNQKDDDSDGYVDNINGIGFDEQQHIVPEYFYCGVENQEEYHHGTAVASVLVGHNPQVVLHGVGFIPTTQRLSASGILSKTTEERISGLAEEYKQMKYFIDESLKYFSKMECKVVNISWGLSLKQFIINNPNIGHSSYQKEINARAWLGHLKEYLVEGFSQYPEIIFVVAAGNESSHVEQAIDVPATIKLKNVIVVGALNAENTNRANFSNYGEDIVYASGTNITCRIALKKEIINTGTSLAVPVVSGLIANLLLIDQKLSFHLTPQLLLKTAREQGLNIKNK